MNRQIFEYHNVIGYRYIPNLQVRIQHENGGYLVKTNGCGFRSEFEFLKKKSGAPYRILLFGDSYTAADGVSNKHRYSDVLMKTIPGVEIYNFGMPGTGTDQQYLIYKEFAKDIEHDLVMIVVQVENIRRVVSGYRYYLNDRNEKIIYQKPFFQLDNGILKLRNVPVNPQALTFDELPESERNLVEQGGRFPMLRSFINYIGFKEVIQKVTHYQVLPDYGKGRKEWMLLKNILLHWIDQLEKPVLLVHLPLHQYIEGECDYSNIAKRFEEFNELRNVTVLNPLPSLADYPAKEKRNFRFPHDCHPTPMGHEAIGKAIRPTLEKLLINN